MGDVVDDDGGGYHGRGVVGPGVKPGIFRVDSRAATFDTPGVGIELLGPLRVDGDGGSLQRRDQVVLSALAVQAGEVLSADQLAEALWGEAPPEFVAETDPRLRVAVAAHTWCSGDRDDGCRLSAHPRHR